MKKKGFKLPTAYSILLIITVVIAIITQFIPGVKPARFSDVIMAPINGLKDAIDISLYVLLMGGFLGVVTKTGALDAGIGAVVKKLNGKELLLIPILMFIFSLGGTSYGMSEETLAFYALVTATMMAAGFDSLTAVATIALGAGSGVLGSTVNPFLVSTSIDSLKGVGIATNQAVVIGIGVALWLSSLLISIFSSDFFSFFSISAISACLFLACSLILFCDGLTPDTLSTFLISDCACILLRRLSYFSSSLCTSACCLLVFSSRPFEPSGSVFFPDIFPNISA